MSDVGLATLSDNLMSATVIVYCVAMLGYAAESAFGRRRRAEKVVVEYRQKTLVGVGGPAHTEAVSSGGSDSNDAGEADRSRLSAETIGVVAVTLTALGWLLHLGELVTRGLAADRLPWGNMYEFTSALTFGAVTAFLFLLIRQRVRFLGLFVMIPVVLGLGVAVTVLYSPVGPLVPALHSYWLAIHVTAAVTAAGAFTVGTAATVLYLITDRYERLRAGGRSVGLSGVAGHLPDAKVLDRIAYRTFAFAFPVWTFAVIAGAIWAEAAWGRYWGWDPKETWSFITWVVFAGYLHARATAGWRGRPAAVIALLGFLCFLFNFFGVNIWVVGLHSYGGLN